MIRKTLMSDKTKAYVRVTFTIPNVIWADKINLVGNFNDWHRASHPFCRDREGKWTITVDLDLGRAYQFRYLIDDENWTNDDQADAYVHNLYGTDNFVVITDPNFERHTDD